MLCPYAVARYVCIMREHCVGHFHCVLCAATSMCSRRIRRLGCGARAPRATSCCASRRRPARSRRHALRLSSCSALRSVSCRLCSRPTRASSSCAPCRCERVAPCSTLYSTVRCIPRWGLYGGASCIPSVSTRVHSSWVYLFVRVAAEGAAR